MSTQSRSLKRYLACIVCALVSIITACGNGTGASNNWTTRPPVNGDSLSYVNWSGKQFIALTNTLPAVVLTSPDGATWTASTLLGFGSSPLEPWLEKSIIWTGQQYVAIGETGIIKISPDGLSWSSPTVNYSNPDGGPIVTSVTWNGKDQYVAVGPNGTVTTSPDAASWTIQTSGTPNRLNGVHWTGSSYVAVGNAGTILTSPNGITWTAQTSGTSENLHAVVSSGAHVLAVGDQGTIIGSTDGGNTWSAQTSGTTNTLNGVATNNTQIVAVGDQGTMLTSSWS